MPLLPMTPTPCPAARRRLLRAATCSVAVVLLAAPLRTRAQPAPLVLEGQSFERRLQLVGAELTLNGVGVRAVAWFKGFVAGLYLPQPALTPAAVLAQPGPKRVQIRMLQEVPAEELAKALDKGMLRNTAASEQPLLGARLLRMGQLIRAAGSVRKGDVIDLDLDPARGTLVSINGKLQGPAIEGEDFYAALLRSFVGDRPYDKRLKAGLLSGLGS